VGDGARLGTWLVLAEKRLRRRFEVVVGFTTPGKRLEFDCMVVSEATAVR